MSMDFIFDLLILAFFFGRGDTHVCHSLLGLFVFVFIKKFDVLISRGGGGGGGGGIKLVI